MTQYFKFPMEVLRVTQGENGSHSHRGSLAMDFGGRDGGQDKLYCPCDMVVKRVRNNANGELYLESVSPVKFADGTEDYARLLCMHDNKFNVVVGYVIKQGEYFYDEGGMGGGKAGKFANHCHIEVGKGKWKSCTQSANKYGTFVIENQSSLYDLFVVGDDVVFATDPETGEVLDGGYPWVTVSRMETVDTVPDVCDTCTRVDQLQRELTDEKIKNAILVQENKMLSDKLAKIIKILEVG